MCDLNHSDAVLGEMLIAFMQEREQYIKIHLGGLFCHFLICNQFGENNGIHEIFILVVKTYFTTLFWVAQLLPLFNKIIYTSKTP